MPLHPLLYDTLSMALELTALALLFVAGSALNLAVIGLIAWLANLTDKGDS